MDSLEVMETKVLEYLEGELDAEGEKAFLAEVAASPELNALLLEYQQQDRQLAAHYTAQAKSVEKMRRPELMKLPVAIAGLRQQRVSWQFRAAAAAAVLAAILGGGTLMKNQIQSMQPGANIVAMKGKPQVFTDNGMKAVTAGMISRGVDTVKIPSGAYAELAMADGAGKIELNANSTVRLVNRAGSQMDLERGEMLVWADAKKAAKVDVSTPYFNVRPANAAVFNVARGLKGAEVSVIKGEVEVLQAGARKTVRAGESFSSTGSTPLAMTERVKWSSSNTELLAMIPSQAAAITADAQDPAGVLIGGVAFSPAFTTEATKPVTSEIPALAAVEIASAPEAVAAPAGAQTYMKSETTILSPSSTAIGATTIYLPSKTVAFAEIPNLGSIFKNSGARNLEELVRTPQVHQALENFLFSTNMPTAELEKGLGRLDTVFTDEDIAVLLRSINGSLSIAATDNGPILVAEVVSNTEEVRKLVETRLEPYFAGENPNQDRLHAAFVNSMLVIALNTDDFNQTVDGISKSQPTDFGSSAFVNRLRSEVAGSQFTVAMDVKGMVGRAISGESGSRNIRGLTRSGLINMQSIVAATSFSDQGNNRAVRIQFEGARQGVASWLDEPGPFATPKFFTPDAYGFVAMRIKRPAYMLEQMFQWAREDNPMIAQTTTPASEDDALLQHFASSLGNEVAFGLDNPLLPIPNVKAAFEVIDPAGFHDAMLELVAKIDSKSPADRHLVVEADDYRGHMVVALHYPDSAVAVTYAIVDDFVLFGPGRGFLTSTIDTVESGRSLDREYAFIDALPARSGSGASFLMYHSAAKGTQTALPLLREVMAKHDIPDFSTLTATVDANDSKPGICYAVAQDDRVDVFVEGVKGDYQMAGVLPIVADFLNGTSAPKAP